MDLSVFISISLTLYNKSSRICLCNSLDISSLIASFLLFRLYLGSACLYNYVINTFSGLVLTYGVIVFKSCLRPLSIEYELVGNIEDMLNFSVYIAFMTDIILS